MVVQHNLQAMNANRMLGLTTAAQSKATEKLSSGYRINRAADDAAGLSISEKMRKQIRGLDQASTNAQDGVSAVQTAEGALTEVHAMLQRMNELATQAANGTNSESDRQAIQDEIDQLTTEIDRVAETTKFNETYLLKGDGTMGTKILDAHDAGLDGEFTSNEGGSATYKVNNLEVGSKVSIGGTEYTIVDSSDASDYKNVNGYADASGDKIIAGDKTYIYYAIGDKDANGATVNAAGWYEAGDSTQAITAKANIVVAGNTLVSGGQTQTFIGETGTTYTITDMGTVSEQIRKVNSGDDVTVNGDTYTIGTTSKGNTYTADDVVEMIKAGDYVNDGTNNYYVLPAASEKATEISLSEAYDKMAEELKKANDIGADENTLSEIKNNGDGTFEITQGKVSVANGLSFNLHVGADADMTNKITVSIDAMSAAGLGVKGINVLDESGAAATYAIDAIADAIAAVSSQRSALGAVQNRLEHTIDNLDNVVENTTAAESRIRDTDMAETMVEYSKNNILAQAGQSMLAQANQSTQGVLSLLQ